MDQGIIAAMVIQTILIITALLTLTLDEPETRGVAGFFSVVASVINFFVLLGLLVHYYNNVFPIISGR